MHPKLKRYISTVGDLPSVPALAGEVMRLVEDPSTCAEDLRRVIDRDVRNESTRAARIAADT